MLALLGEARRPALVREELGVAAPAPPAGGGQPAIAVVEQLGEHSPPYRSDTTVPSGTLISIDAPRLPWRSLPLPCTPFVGPAVGMVAERQQRRHVVVGDEPDVAALAAVAPVRTAHHDRALPPERHAARAAVAATYVELALVDELGHPRQRYRPPPTPFCLLQMADRFT